MSKYNIIEAMQEYGGGFAKRLAEAWKYADEENKRKIESTWADYFSRYEAMAVNKDVSP